MIRLQQRKEEMSRMQPEQLLRRKQILEEETKFINDMLAKK